MTTRRWSRVGLIIGLSALAHGAILLMLALTHPELRLAAPPPVIEVQVVPFYVPTRTRAEARPQPPLAARPLRPRRSLQPERSKEVAPLVTREAPSAAEDAWRLEPPAPEATPSSPDLRNALRRGAAGCAHPALLSRDERAACQERLGAGAADAPFIPPPMSADKRRAFDAEAARQEAYRRYKRGNVPPGLGYDPPRSAPPVPMPEVWTPH